MKKTKTDYLLWGMVLFLLIVTIFGRTGVAPILMVFQFIVMFIFAWVHGSRQYGFKNMVIWFMVTWVVSNFFEGLSIQMGFPFGNYHYTELDTVIPRIWNVPVMIMVSYFAIVYSSWCVALAVTNQMGKKIQGAYKVIVPVTAGLVMAMWDLVSDPTASTISGSWIWEDGGSYFGVPISNFFGWFFVVYIFSQIFTLFISSDKAKLPETTITSTRGYWLQPCLIYLLMGLGVVIEGFVKTDYIEIYRSMGMVAVFTMVFAACVALMHIKESKELTT